MSMREEGMGKSDRGLLSLNFLKTSRIVYILVTSTETYQVGSPCKSDARCSVAQAEMLSKSRHMCQLPSPSMPGGCTVLPCPSSIVSPQQRSDRRRYSTQCSTCLRRDARIVGAPGEASSSSIKPAMLRRQCSWWKTATLKLFLPSLGA